MRSTQLALVCLILALQGCANYMPPLIGPTANVRFYTLPGNKTEIYELDKPRCDSALGKKIAIVGQAVHNETGQGRSVGMPLGDLIPKASSSEITIRSGQAFAAQMQAAAAPGPNGVSWAYAQCTKRFVFHPKQGMNYEAQIEQYDGGCTLNVFRISREAGTYVRRLANNEVTHCR